MKLLLQPQATDCWEGELSGDAPILKQSRISFYLKAFAQHKVMRQKDHDSLALMNNAEHIVSKI